MHSGITVRAQVAAVLAVQGSTVAITVNTCQCRALVLIKHPFQASMRREHRGQGGMVGAVIAVRAAELLGILRGRPWWWCMVQDRKENYTDAEKLKAD